MGECVNVDDEAKYYCCHCNDDENGFSDKESKILVTTHLLNANKVSRGFVPRCSGSKQYGPMKSSMHEWDTDKLRQRCLEIGVDSKGTRKNIIKSLETSIVFERTPPN